MIKMNIPVLVVASIMSLAVVAHVLVGTRETATLRPACDGDGKKRAHWVQAMSAFQMLSVDLVAVTALLFWLAFGDVPYGAQLQAALGLIFLAWGCVWLLQMVFLRQSGVTIWRLPHWVVWFFCAGVLLWP